MVDNLSLDCPITILNNAFFSSLKGVSNGVFRLAIALIYNVR